MNKGNETEQESSGWAICSDDRGLLLHTVSATRKEAIFKLTEIFSGVRCMKEWRKLRREYGFRASHVYIREFLI